MTVGRIVAWLLAAVAAAALACVCLGIWSAGKAERNHLATIGAMDLVCASVHRTGKWPAGWADLLQAREGPPRPFADEANLKQRVIIDFNRTLEDVLLHPERRAVRANGVSYSGEHQYDAMLSELRIERSALKP